MYKDITTIDQNATGVNAIKQSIKNILLTRRGSVPGKPRFGSDLYNVIFSPLDHLTVSLAKNYIREALSEFEDRIEIRKIDIERVEEYNRIVVNLTFTYKDIDTHSDTSDEVGTTAISFNL